MGIERLLNVAASEGLEFPSADAPDLFIGFIGEKGRRAARKLAYELQDRNVHAVYDINLRSLKAQLKYADKLNARFSLVLGDDEVDQNKAKLKNMTDGSETVVDIDPERLAAAL